MSGHQGRRLVTLTTRWLVTVAAIAVGVAINGGVLDGGGVARAQTGDQTGDPCNAVDTNSTITLVVSSPSADDPSPFRSVDVPFVGWAQGGSNVLGQPLRVDSVEVRLASCAPEYEPPASSANVVQPGTGRRDFSWTQQFPRNGRYQASVIARGEQNQTSVRVRRFAVEVPPAKPAGVAAVAVSSKQVDVSWNANPEPDVRNYELWRTPANSSTPTLITTTSASIRKASDTSVVPGSYTYFVRAVRPDADGKATIVSADSNHDPVTVAGPNTPTTTPPPDEETSTTVRGGSGGSGGTGSGTTGTGTGSTGGSSTGSGTGSASPGATSGPTGTIDLSNFAALLDSRRRVAAGNPAEVDPGFGETLPFRPGDEPAVGGEDAGETTESANDLDELPSDDTSDRRRSFSFFAGGLLLFVMSMSLLFVRGEVKRIDLLEAIDLDAPDEADEATKSQAPFELSPLDVPLH